MKAVGQVVLRRLKIWTSYILFVIAGLVCFLYFRVFNRIRIIGRKNIPRQGRLTLLVPNHQSMHDSWIIGAAGYFPDMIAWPSLPPYNLAAKENFFGNWLLKTVLQLLRTIPVDRGRFSRKFLEEIVALLRHANVCIFYQGTRSDDLTRAKNGTAFVIAHSHPTPVVVPVYLEGTDRLFGGGPGVHSGLARWLPRFPGFGRKTTVVFGSVVDFSDLLENRDDPKLYDKITRRIVNAIENLRRQVSEKPKITSKISA